MALAYFFVFFALSNLVLLHSIEEEIRYDTECPPFNHGVIGKIGFLFINSTLDRGIDCRWFSQDTCGEPVQRFQLESEGKLYDVLSIHPDDTVEMLDTRLRERIPSCKYKNFTSRILPPISFKSTPRLTLLSCERNLKIIAHPYSCLWACDRSLKFVAHPYSCFNGYPDCNVHSDPNGSLPPQCSHPGSSPLNMNRTNYDLFSQIDVNLTFQIQVSGDCRMCYFKGGQCRNYDDGETQCDDAGKKLLALKLGLAFGIGCLAILTICFFFFLLCCNKQNFLVFGKMETQNHQSVEVFLRNCGSLAPKRYSYSTVKEMTNSFKNKLGQGGYGSVYKGKLRDGRLVAVKVLNKSKGDGEEFINEVASISRTSHVNVVTLLGFCFEGSKRALIYEFMSNGSLEKFIYENPLRENRQLGWETLYQIAIGIARGLEYLHRGCNTRILHFDIKPHNILLDEDFCPKIADFGLAKLCPKKESIISMQGARGTAGYIAPEVFSRHFGGVSHKSDVYSYGMMVLEMVGGRKNIDVGVDHASEIYFPHWIYKRLHEQGDQLGLHGVMNEEENEKVRKMILVGLWCIQTGPSNRPPMSRVVDMLQGSLGSLQIPPKPFLSSPQRSPADSLTTHTVTL